MDNSQLDLLRLVDLATKQSIERNLSLSFADLYGLIGDVQDNACALEKDLDRTLYGQGLDGEPRLNKPRV